MSPVPPISTEHIFYARAVADLIKPNKTQQVTLAVAAAYIVIIGILVSDTISDRLNTPAQCLIYSGTHIPYLEKLIYPFKLLTVGMHEMSHAVAGVLTCARVESITLDPYEGGSTRMRGGIPVITLPAGYLGSSFIGAALITTGFDTNASKVAVLVLAVFWLLTLWWARGSWVAWATIAFVAGLVIVTWLVADSVALRFFVLFVGVMSCFYSIWDIIDDTLERKINTSDASEYASTIGCCGSRFWGAFWLFISCAFFAAGIIVGIVAFKDDWGTQADKAKNFLGGSP